MMMPRRSNFSGSWMPIEEADPSSQPTRPFCRCSPMRDMNALSPAPTADTRLPRKPIGSEMIAMTACAALARTPSSMSFSCRIVLITPTTASIALAIRPLFFSFSASISSSTLPSASVYLLARVSTSSLPLLSTDSVSWSNFSLNSPAACLPSACSSFGSWRTSA